MPITARQQDDRQGAFGASDIGALFGCDPFKSRADIYLQKVYGVQSDAGKAAEAGTYLEAGILDYAADHLGKIRRNVTRRAPNGIPIKVHLDCILIASYQPVECKTAGLFAPLMDHWGEAGSDDVPSRVNLQLHAQMLCTDAGIGYVVAFLGGRGFVIFRIVRNERIICAIADLAQAFWVNHVLARIMPSGDPPSMATIKGLIRVPNKTIRLDESCMELADQVKAAQAESTEADKYKEGIKAELAAKLGDAEVGLLPDGRKVTLFLRKKKGYTVDPSEVRTLYIRKA